MSLVLPFASSSRRIAVLGGGVSGLAAAFRLSRMGHSVRLFERSGRLGGMIHTEAADGWLAEAGPAFIQELTPLVTAVIKGIGANRERVDAAPLARRRYVVRRGRLVPMPGSPAAAAFSGLFSPLGKLGLLRDVAHRRRPGGPDRSFYDLIRAHCGREAAEYVAQPLAAGTFAGDAEKLSARYAFPRVWEMDQLHGSFLRARREYVKACEKRYENVVPATFSFRRGMQTLAHGYVLQLPADVIALNARVEGLVPGPKWHVIWRDLRGREDGQDRDWSKEGDDGRQVEGFDAVIAALPAATLAQLEFGERGVRPLSVLGEIEHVPLCSLFLGYRREQVGHPLDGFEVVAPKCERRAFLRASFDSSVFPGRAPEGCVALTVLVGGALRPELAGRPAGEVLQAVTPDLAELLGIRGEPVFMRHHPWAGGLPQYNLGHQRFLEAVSRCEKDHRGFFIGGQVRDGVSVAQRMLGGERLAERVHAYCTG